MDHYISSRENSKHLSKTEDEFKEEKQNIRKNRFFTAPRVLNVNRRHYSIDTLFSPVKKESNYSFDEEDINLENETKSPIKKESLFCGESASLIRSIHLIDLQEDKLIPYFCIMTNFRFILLDPKNSDNIYLSIPLGTIGKIKKATKKAVAKKQYLLIISCKNLLTLYLCFFSKVEQDFFLNNFISRLPKHIEDLFAFTVKKYYEELISCNGWSIYDSIKDYQRMNLPDELWRISDVNLNYQLSSSYPQKLVVPASVTDEDLIKVAAFRSKGRIPVCVWRHNNGAALIRCSQPLVGMKRSRCIEDEKLFSEIGKTNPNNSTLYIVDSRPKVNAQANAVMGMGYESSTYYQDCILEFLNIANIHVMRESLLRLIKFDEAAVEQSGWLEHVRKILLGAARIMELMIQMKVSVVAHCSDGWDRTSQTVALAEVMMDPFYRTINGFIIILEKEFLSFGHKMAQRSGHDEMFATENYKDKETSPVVLQFLDGIWQLLQQFPTAFEFNSKLLVVTMDHIHSCLFGTFLFNCQQERQIVSLNNRTLSFWSFVQHNLNFFLNPAYILFEGVLNPRIKEPKDMLLWTEYYFRWRSKRKMNGMEYIPIDFKLKDISQSPGRT